MKKISIMRNKLKHISYNTKKITRPRRSPVIVFFGFIAAAIIIFDTIASIYLLQQNEIINAIQKEQIKYENITGELLKSLLNKTEYIDTKVEKTAF